MTVVKLLKDGLGRVLNGEAGMTFIVDSFTDRISGGKIAHVRDYRWIGNNFPYQIWTIGPEGYEVIGD